MAKTLKSLSPGTTLVVPDSSHNGVPLILRKLADDHHAVGTTLLDTRDIIDLIAFDGKERSNSFSREYYGNNNYGLSNIRKYLNSVGPNWYTPQHAEDEPPSEINVWDRHGPYDKRNGFLSAFPSEFVERIVTTTLTTVVPNIDGADIATQKDKVFLLSRTEVGLGDEREAEGRAIPFFKDNAARLKKPTQEAISKTTYTDPNLGGRPNRSKAWHWWLRSPLAATAYNLRYVRANGTLSDSYSFYSGFGAAPALNLPSDMLVSDEPNAEGHYEIILVPPIGAPKIKIGTEKKEILEMYLKVGGSNKAVIETSILINGTNKPWV